MTQLIHTSVIEKVNEAKKYIAMPTTDIQSKYVVSQNCTHWLTSFWYIFKSILGGKETKYPSDWNEFGTVAGLRNIINDDDKCMEIFFNIRKFSFLFVKARRQVQGRK